jgi:hypothetical protein
MDAEQNKQVLARFDPTRVRQLVGAPELMG